MSEITLIVRVKAKLGREKALEHALRAVVSPTHLEPGCLRFALHRSTADTGTFLLVERWTGQSALDEHMKEPYLTRLLAELKELAEPSDVGTYELLQEGDIAKLL
jgi:quinol monooxygenase YgiN